MKLFYKQGACSLSPHIALFEAGADFQAVAVGRDKKTADGRDFLTLNPYGYVPALELEDGEVIAEGPAIVQYIADRFPEAGIAPPNGTRERVRVQSALTFIGTELHKTIGGLFQPHLAEAEKAKLLDKAFLRLDQLSVQMAGKQWIANDTYSVADAYLFTVLRWLGFFDVDLARWPVLAAHQARMLERPAVQQALRAEKLIRDEAA
jgi:glutathione S-transferase